MTFSPTGEIFFGKNSIYNQFVVQTQECGLFNCFNDTVITWCGWWVLTWFRNQDG